MSNTVLHRMFAPLRRSLPAPASRMLRAGMTALLTPAYFSGHTGHWRSSLQSKALAPEGTPLPWYTYPCIDFLGARRDRVRTVLEFGAGQSTLWWAAAGAHVVAFEADPEWYAYLRGKVPSNVDLRLATVASAEACIADVRRQLQTCPVREFDMVVVDGLFRSELAALSPSWRAARGAILCDDAEGYDLNAALRGSGLQRVDFFGFAPGVILPRCTALYFAQSDLFDATIPVVRAPG
jgi:hypothetical protein